MLMKNGVKLINLCLIWLISLWVFKYSYDDRSPVEKRLDYRRRHFKSSCHRLGLDKPGNDSLHKPNPWEYLINKEYHLIWCNVFKAASTSWLYNFNILAGYHPAMLNKSKTPGVNLARRKYPRPSLQELQEAFTHSLSFIIVRHPLERLLSAYKNKFEFAPPINFYTKLARSIVLRYRHNFQKDMLNRNYGLLLKRFIPTFPEFVQYLLDSAKNNEKLDEHWISVTQFCTPCLFDFKVLKIIAHTETLDEDQDFLIKIAKLENVLRKEWRNAAKKPSSDDNIKYFSQLTRSQILQLCDVYKEDFDLFDYSKEEYLNMAIKDG